MYWLHYIKELINTATNVYTNYRLKEALLQMWDKNDTVTQAYTINAELHIGGTFNLAIEH